MNSLLDGTKYNKLIRDKIPEIIEENGEKPSIHVADDIEYAEKLRQKLYEEIEEFLEEESPEEMADILEVLRAYAKKNDLPFEDVEGIRRQKFSDRGGFEKRLILDEVLE